MFQFNLYVNVSQETYEPEGPGIYHLWIKNNPMFSVLNQYHSLNAAIKLPYNNWHPMAVTGKDLTIPLSVSLIISIPYRFSTCEKMVRL